MQIRFTKHAEDMLRERNIDRTLVESAVQNPDWKKDADNELWYAFKRVGTKVLRTVVKGKEKPYTVIGRAHYIAYRKGSLHRLLYLSS